MTSSASRRPTCPQWARDFQRGMFEAGYLVPGWPPELGGRNATPQEQMVYFEVLTERMAPRSLNPQGLSICAASIVEFGNEEQKERFVLPTLRGEITWCVGMSEPNAGSDLASLTTRAELREDHFVVNGQKVWTSGAHESDLCMCYVRTDPDAPKHRGISVLIIDMQHARHHLPAPARADRPATTPTSTRCSSPTSRCPPRTWSASSTRAGRSARARCATSGGCSGS